MTRRAMTMAAGAWALVALGSGAAAIRGDEPLDEAARKEIVDLPRTYRSAEGAAAQKKVLQRAVELGPKGTARLRPIVEGAMNRELGKYLPMFQRALATLAAQADAELSVEGVLKASEPLAQQRALLAAAIELAEILGPDPQAKEPAKEPATSYADQLAALEQGAVAQLKLARSMRTLDTAEQQLIRGINQQRAGRGLPPLEVDAALCRAAKGHSFDMNQHGFFSHDSPLPGKKSFTDRAKLAGTRAAAENIAKGRSGPQVVEMWMDSDGHRRNILSNTRRIGVGRAGGYFTALFGR